MSAQAAATPNAGLAVLSALGGKLPADVTSTVDKQKPAGKCRATRYAIKFDPPCFCLEYEDAVLKKRVRQVKLSKVSSDVDPERLTRKIIRSFPRQLDAKAVKYEQVRKLVVKLLDDMRSKAAQSQLDLGLGGALSSPAAPPLLRSLSPTRVLSPFSVPASAAQSYQRSSTVAASVDRFSTSSAGDPDSGDDQEVGVEQDTEGRSLGLTGSGNVDMDGALSELERELGGSTSSSSAHERNGRHSLTPADSGPSPSLRASGPFTPCGSMVSLPSLLATTSSGAADVASSIGKRSRFAQEAERLVLEIDVEGDVDLNKVTDVELKLAKLKMEEKFVKNQVLPGDPSYEYDKQVEFGPATEANDWDESGDEEELEQEPSKPSNAVGFLPSQAASSGPGLASPASKAAAPLSLSLGRREEDDDDGDSYSYGDQPSDDISPVSVPDELSPGRMRFDADESLDWQ